MMGFASNKSAIFIAVITCLLWSSCYKDKGPVIVKPVIPPPLIPVLVSFSKEIQPIFQTSCVSCHTETHPSLNLKTCCSWYELWYTGKKAPYVDTITPGASLLYRHLVGDGVLRMPPTGQPLSQDEKDLIYKWMDEGALNN